MSWQFWQSPKPKSVPEEIRNALVSQFRMRPQDIEPLRILRKSGKFAGRSVRYVQIFDPGSIKNGASRSLKFAQLDVGGEFRNALLFGGHVEKDGAVYLSDHRPKKARAADE